MEIWMLYQLTFMLYQLTFDINVFVTNRQTGQKLYAQDLLMPGHKNRTNEVINEIK